MARTASTMVPLGRTATTFKLTDTKCDRQLSLEELRGELATVIMFICNHCPFVKHINPELVRLANDYTQKGVSFVAISSNDAVAYPQDGPAEMKKTAGELGYPFPYLYDETQSVAKAYGAVCTPDFFVYDGDLRLVYRGQLDGSRPGNGIPVTGKDLREALDCVQKGQSVSTNQRASIGCSIKWKIKT